MSSYLTFYLVPKKEKSESQKPLVLTSFSRNSNIYQAFTENANIAFIGINENHNYTELTNELIGSITRSLREDLEKTNSRSQAKIKALKDLPELKGEALEEYIYETTEMQEYIKELKSTLKYIEFISDIISDIDDDFTDFEKVLVNIN